MNIVIIRTNTSDFGKVGTYNVQEIGLANALIRKGHNVTVLFLNKKTDSIISDKNYRFVYYLPHKSIGIHGIFDVNILERFRPEIVILFSDNQLWAKEVIMWCKNNSIKCIQYMGAVLSDNPGWLHQLYTMFILKRNVASYHYSLNVAKTTKVKNEMKQLGVPFAKVINIGLDIDLLKPNINLDFTIRNELGYSKNDKIVLFVGRIVDYKRPFLACDIIRELHKNNKQYHLILLGKGPLQNKLIKYINDEGINDCVRYIERVPYNDMYKYMVASDCLINLSAKEIFGMTILEAMYYALPVVAHVAPGPNDIIQNNKTGLLCNTDSINEWCLLIQECIKRRKELGENARKDIEKRFLWDSLANEFIKL